MNMKLTDYYVGSISYDNDEGEFDDHILWGIEKHHLYEKMVKFMGKRKSAEVLFVSRIVHQKNAERKEYNITELAKQEIRKQYGVG